MRLQDMCREYNIRFKKQLGQNLLLDDNINRIMVDAAALSEEDDVIEVGAGLGALTEKLYPLARRILAIEIDPSFMPCLEDRFETVDNIRLFRGDVLNHEPRKLAEEYLPGPDRLKMASNLPYYITTPILFHFWESSLHFDRMIVMVQAEVAERLCAGVNTANYGVLALAAEYYSEVDIVHHVPKTCFRPMPKVDSCVVRLRNRETPLYPGVAHDLLFGIIHKAFRQRRKTLRNTLGKAPELGIDRDAALDALSETGIDPSRRPQTLTLAEFAAVAKALSKKRA
ncbi:MAG: 16S rRNA (adenine(1518)-N(6)/adenine(1519)-N(6))-dimethyltransferase RsmA [Candidatus Hydrogenedentota bacterium]